MIEHTALGLTAPDRTAGRRTAITELLRAGGPSGDAGAAPVDLVCADRELLAAEFSAIIAANFSVAANFPVAADRPRPCDRSVPVLTGTDVLPPRHARRPCPPRPARGSRTVAPHPRPRERGPPRA